MTSLSTLLVCTLMYKIGLILISINLYVKKTKIFINELINIITSEFTMLAH